MTIDYEKLGAFYLGRVFDPQRAAVTDELVLYDSKDLTTHAVCVGMTGSGKTGLCISLLEEAAIDGVPALAIDPKGDLANLFLTFPELRAADFRPWIDPAEAARKGETPDRYAAEIASRWKEGLSQWGQDGSRIRRLRESVELTLYTPGSTAVRPLRVLRSLTAPPPEARDGDAMRERIQNAVSGLLSLLGIAADPVRSREHILLANLVGRAWSEGRDLELASLIQDVQTPPFDRLGVVDLETFFPEKERVELAMSLNGLLASPGFGAWMEGDPLDVARLLFAEDGRPRLTVLSIAHLSDNERMFFVTQLLNEVVSWMRTQPGTSSLRALLYMDEVFGYFPPTANPPSKAPMLTLLKQARAYGLGVVLATQNPVDLDYKGLSNAGTWFLGRLQTERDKLRVLEGLEGAAAATGSALDRAAMDLILSGLGSRVFLMNNVHEDEPVLFHTRWALSYLRGPLTREQLRELAGKAPTPVVRKAARREPAPSLEPRASERPTPPSGLAERFASAVQPAVGGGRLVYRPALLGRARLHYVHRSAQLDHWETQEVLAPLAEKPGARFWDAAETLERPLVLQGGPATGAGFAALPRGLGGARAISKLGKGLASRLYRTATLTLFRAPELKQVSQPGHDLSAFRASLRHAARERRDVALEKLRRRYASKLARLRDRIRRAESRLEREQSQHKQQKLQTAVSLGATLVGALFGRKVASVGNVGRATTTARGVGRIAREGEDVSRASERVEELRDQLAALEADFEEAAADLEERFDPDGIEIEELAVRPRKSDIEVEPLELVWTPWWVSPEGIAERAC